MMKTETTALTLPAITPKPSRKAVLEALVRIEQEKRMKETQEHEDKKRKMLTALKKQLMPQVFMQMKDLLMSGVDSPFHNMELSFQTRETENGSSDKVIGIGIVFNIPIEAETSPLLLEEASAYQEECDNEFHWRYTNEDSIRKEIKEMIQRKKAQHPSTSSTDLVNNPQAKEVLTNMLNVLFNEEEG